MNVVLKLVILANGLFVIAGEIFEGDSCIDKQNNENGICKFLNQCPAAKANIQKGIYPTPCGFSGNEIIVCCANPPPSGQTRQPGEISDKMCRNYSQYVWKIEANPLLVIGAEDNDLVTRDCPFDRQQLVVGGDPASRKEFPHMVQIGYEGVPIKWGCGGSLISDQFVLTAAHCLNDRSLGEALFARMGMTDLDDPDHVQTFDITERIFHPQYQEPAHYHDIGLVKLHKKAQLNTWVRPACLYTSSMSPWTKVIATGWGRTFFGGTESTVLLRVILELYDETSCNKIYKKEAGTPRLQDGIKDNLMVCAGHSTELKDTCQGDSGGPLQVYRAGNDPNMTCMYDVIGVTSFGKACGLAANIPGVYTRVSTHLKWIEDHVWPPKST